jgi:hypothetical protein
MNRAQIVDYYIEKSKEKGFELDQIRRELQSRDIPDEEIRAIVRLVDNDMQRELLTKSSSSKSNEIMWAGIVLTVIGAGITLGTYTGLITMGDSFLIVYGPFFAGLSMITGSFIKRRG